jgi:hypothetical protein
MRRDQSTSPSALRLQVLAEMPPEHMLAEMIEPAVKIAKDLATDPTTAR